MGTGISNPQFNATNYVLDYSINLLHPDRYGQIMQRLGPNVNSFPDQGKNQVLADFNECLQNANPALVSEYVKYRNYSYAAIGLFIIGFVLFAIVAASTEAGVTYGWVLMIVFFVIGGIGMFMVNAKAQGVAQQWRQDIIGKLQTKMANWAAMYPQFTFTIIWPVEVWRRSTSRRNGRRRSSRKLVAIWCYVRVTQGPCQTGHNEPILATTTGGAIQQPTQVIVQQPMVQQQPVVVQQGQPQPQTVMVQNAQGQYVQGTPAIVNGQQVIMVQQPVQQQQPVVYQQPMTQQPVQGYPAANGQPVVVMQQQQPQQQQQEALPGYPGAPR